ncbi:MAG: hypothetical protein R3B89_24560 [Polyangiaceae bacterium]
MRQDGFWRSLRTAACMALALSPLPGCSETTDEPGESAGGLPKQRIVSADFLEQKLSVLDYRQVIAGPGSAADVTAKTIDLAAYAPGPLQLELTPDGERALVAVGPGFYDSLGVLFGFPDVSGDGALLIVDLNDDSVSSVPTASAPMGVAITPDGRYGLSANFGTKTAGGSTLTRVDLETQSVVEEVDVGGSPEQVRLFDGSLGLLNTASEGGVRRFDPADVEGSLSGVAPTSADPSDIAFVSATRAVVIDSRNVAGYSVVTLDDSDPGITVVEQVPTDGLPYGICHIPGTSEVLVGIATGTPTKVLRVDVGSTPSTEVTSYELGNTESTFVINVSCSPDGKFAFAPIPNQNALAVIDLETNGVHQITGWTHSAPTYVGVFLGQ